jgi:hypothetical protein
MTIRNPKQDGTILFDAIPQRGPCPNNCNQCFYNRPEAFFVPIDEPHMPTLEEVDNGILRVNSGHDSNINRESVIAATDAYPRRFFNTSIPKFDFPAPVVFTANPQEEKPVICPKLLSINYIPTNIMFVRLRVSSTNLRYIDNGVYEWTKNDVPVILTFMRYFSEKPPSQDEYIWKKSILNSYWCPTVEFLEGVLARYSSNRLVSLCGAIDTSLCKACLNCETYYIQTEKRLKEK